MRLYRFVSTILITALVIGLAGAPAAHAAIHDIIGSRFEEAVTYLNRLGVLEGRPEGFEPAASITRAEATKIIVEIIGKGDLAVLLKGAPSFPDVPGDYWASGYIAVARNQGILHGFPDGTFRPQDDVTYAEYAKMLVEAAGLAPNDAFGWPVNYLDPAQKAGMVKDTDFSADKPAIRGDCAIMTATTVREVRNPKSGRTLGQSVFGEHRVAAIEITPASETTSSGASVQFTAIARDEEGEIVPDAQIDFVTSDAVRSIITETGRFVATNAGTYTVTARCGDMEAVATVNVYGVPAALRASASPGVVAANGVATSTITVEIVDSGGVRVPTASARVTLEHHTNNGAVTLPSVTTVEARNGTATFTITATLLYDASDTLEVSASGLDSDTCVVRTIEPRATKLRLAAEPTQLPANVETIGYVTAEVLDQTGEPMTFGTYYIEFAISGRGWLEGGTDPIIIGTSPVDQKATVQVSSKELEPGSFRITAKAPGLGSQSVSISTYIAGVPRSLKVTPVDTSGEVGGSYDMKAIIGVVDSNGRPAIADELITALLETEDDAELTFMPSDEVVISPGQSYATVEFEGTKAGTHKVTVRETSSVLTTRTTSFSCTVSSGELHDIVVTPDGDPTIYIPISKPQVNLTAQLRDAFGNDVTKSGIRVKFTAEVEEGSGTVTWSKSQGKAVTDSQGRATITMTGQGYKGNAYTVSVAADFDGDGYYDDAEGSTLPRAFRVTDRLPSGFTISFTQGGDPLTYLRADADQEAEMTLQVVDAGGNPVEEHLVVEVSFGNDGRNVKSVSSAYYGLETIGKGAYRTETDELGQVVVSFKGALAGSFTVTAKCLNVIPAATGSKRFSVSGGTEVVRAAILKTDNTPALEVTVRAGRTVALRVALVDNGGNPIGAKYAATIPLDPSASGYYRMTASGANLSEVRLAKGVAYQPIYYINDYDRTLDLYDDAYDFSYEE